MLHATCSHKSGRNQLQNIIEFRLKVSFQERCHIMIFCKKKKKIAEKGNLESE